jgi:DeoD family purine-nucleoside phosphorylase
MAPASLWAPDRSNLVLMDDPVHLRPTAPLAERVLLPGDPGRALLLAQTLLEKPIMFNHTRGLWGYSGVATDGELMTIQSSGMGGPSAAIVVRELAELGARRIVRVGTCGALDPQLQLGDVVAVTRAIAADGTSRALGVGDDVRGTPALLSGLSAGADRTGAVVSTDLFYDDRAEPYSQWAARGALAVEMEAATVLALAGRLGLLAGAILIVSDLVLPTRVRIEPERLRMAEERAGAIALAGLQAAGAAVSAA